MMCKKCKLEKKCNYYEYYIGRNIISDFQSYNHGTSSGWNQKSVYTIIGSNGVHVCNSCILKNVVYTYLASILSIAIPSMILFFAFENDFWGMNTFFRVTIGLVLGFFLFTIGIGAIASIFSTTFLLRKHNEEFSIKLCKGEIENEYLNEVVKFPGDSAQAEEVDTIRVLSQFEYKRMKTT